MDGEENLQFERVGAESVQIEGLTLTVGRLIHAPAAEIFAVLRDPTQHAELDAKEMNRAPEAESSGLINEVGDEFTLNMFADVMGGDYQMTNRVTKFEENEVIGWKPMSEGRDKPLGQQWTWGLEPEDEQSTYVTLTYDWEDITNEKFLEQNTFPLFPIDSFKESVAALARLVEDPSVVEREWGDIFDPNLEEDYFEDGEPQGPVTH